MLKDRTDHIYFLPFFFITDVVECDSSPCDVNAACVNDIGSFACPCNTGYTGDGLDGAEFTGCSGELNSLFTLGLCV